MSLRLKLTLHEFCFHYFPFVFSVASDQYRYRISIFDIHGLNRINHRTENHFVGHLTSKLKLIKVFLRSSQHFWCFFSRKGASDIRK